MGSLAESPALTIQITAELMEQHLETTDDGECRPSDLDGGRPQSFDGMSKYMLAAGQILISLVTKVLFLFDDSGSWNDRNQP
jgi:hypothetical protein